jgi:hypothetical protein
LSLTFRGVPNNPELLCKICLFLRGGGGIGD